MRITFLNLSKQVGSNSPYTHRLWRLRRKLPYKAFTWGPEICRKLASRGHTSRWIGIETAQYMRRFWGESEIYTHTENEKFSLCYCHGIQFVRQNILESDAVIIRHDYNAYGDYIADNVLAGKKVILIVAGPKFSKLNYYPNCENFTLLVNSQEELHQFQHQGIRTEIFQKPASSLYYKSTFVQGKKCHDILFVAWDTSVKRKRFDLFLSSLIELNAITDRDIFVAVVGNAKSHKERIYELNNKLRNIDIKLYGKLASRDLRKVYQNSKMTVVPSDQDANPQVISESLASGVPVLCTHELTGGLFQINSDSGSICDSNPSAIAGESITMLNNIGEFQTRKVCITQNDATNQIELLLHCNSDT